MKNLFRQLKFYTAESILGPLFKLLEAMFELFVPLVVADIIDNGIASSDRPYILSKVGILAALAFIGLICSLTAQYFAARAAVGCTGRLRYLLFSHIGKLSFSDIDRVGVSTLITRLTGDLNQVQNGVNISLRLLLRSPFVVAGAMVMAFFIDPRTSLIFLAVIAVLSVVVFGIILGSVPAYKKVQGNLDNLTGTTRENLTGTRVIRAFGMEEAEREKFANYNSELKKSQQFAGMISAFMNPVTLVILNLGIIVLLYSGAIDVNSGKLTTGQVVALYNYMTQILVELVKFANLIISITKSISCMKRVDEILNIQPDMSFVDESAEQKDSEYAIEFRGVCLNYNSGGDSSLSNISFAVEHGETVGVIGGTGSGKTSLINLILRFYDATEGEVLVDGVNVKNYSAHDLRKKIGYVLQKPMLFKGTVRQNLTFGKADATDGEIAEAIRVAQAEDVIKSKENGLDSAVKQYGRNFSGGQRQRLTIARALVGRPRILILDDSASALDFATDAALRREIKNLPYKHTTVIVSQRTSSIMHADKIIVLDDGLIAGIGRHAELLESCVVYREIYESQYKKEVQS